MGNHIFLKSGALKGVPQTPLINFGEEAKPIIGREDQALMNIDTSTVAGQIEFLHRILPWDFHSFSISTEDLVQGVIGPVITQQSAFE
jgi:hypothetical protein